MNENVEIVVINWFLIFSLCLTSLLQCSRGFPIPHNNGQRNVIAVSLTTNKGCYFRTMSKRYNLFLCL